MSAGVCAECGREAPAVDEVALLEWEGGPELHFELLDAEMVTLVCPECQEHLEHEVSGQP